MAYKTIIFDTKENCAELSLLLKRSPFEVIATPQKASELHSSCAIHLPDLVIVQFSSVAEVSKLASRHRDACIVVSPESHQAKHIEEVFNHGARAYLTQPYELDKLIAILMTAIKAPQSKFHIKNRSCY